MESRVLGNRPRADVEIGIRSKALETEPAGRPKIAVY
jgi:hypothetical protein